MKRKSIPGLAVVLAMWLGPSALAKKAGEAKEQVPGMEIVRGTERIQFVMPRQTKVYVERTPPENQETARKIFHRANEMFEKQRVDEALRLYRKAYKLWPHPRILFNIAVSLGMLAQPLESAQAFRKVLEYGPDPITPERYKQAQERYKELVGQLAQIRVVCPEPGARVFVDGQFVGKGPLDNVVTIGPGMHLVSASKKGKVPFTKQVSLNPGYRATIKIKLQAFDVMVQWRSVPRYHWGLPAGMTALTVALAASGLGLLLKGRSDIDDIMASIDEQQRLSGPSIPFTYDVGKEDRAITMQIAGQVLLGLAGATAVASTVLWIVRKKKVRYVPEVGPGGGPKLEVRF